MQENLTRTSDSLKAKKNKAKCVLFSFVFELDIKYPHNMNDLSVFSSRMSLFQFKIIIVL
jgi:hypothetical protein